MSDPLANVAYLVLGSNIEAETYMPAAVRELAAFGTIQAASQVWETEPVGFVAQANFLNAAVAFATALSVGELHDVVFPQIEHSLDRARDPHNGHGPRTIDIDIALFNDAILPDRNIPDPDIFTRRFVAELLAEIAPGYVHPVTKQTLREIADRMSDAPPKMWPRPDVVLSPGDRHVK